MAIKEEVDAIWNELADGTGVEVSVIKEKYPIEVVRKMEKRGIIFKDRFGGQTSYFRDPSKGREELKLAKELAD